MAKSYDLLSTLEKSHIYPRPFPGIPREFWINNIDQVRVFIEKHNLKPIDHEQLIGKKKESDLLYATRYIDLKEGGMRSPHLHFNGERYRLTQEQWQAFSRPILKEFSRRLAAADSVTFEDFMEVDEALNNLM